MKIVLAPDSFKESLSSIKVCDAMESGIKKVFPHAQIVKIPLADGGEGTVHTLVAATSGSTRIFKVCDPLGQTIEAELGLLGEKSTAVLEMASASGLALVPPAERNPLKTTTFGTGELIKAALDLNVNKIIIGIGGSATNDCGTGIAQALGAKFFENNSLICEKMCGGLLGKVTRIDISGIDPRIHTVDIEVACDVDNPLLGKQGATATFGPQKGATAKIVEQLEKNMEHIIELIEQKTTSVRHKAGAGAAGGLGAGLMAFCNASLGSGIDTVLNAVDFDTKVKDADLILTGEGKIDAQSAMGKTISGILKRKPEKVPVIAIGGAISSDADVLYQHGLHAMFSICQGPILLKNSLQESYSLIQKSCENIIRTFIH